MKNIIAKGGGSLALLKTLSIDAEIIKQTGKKKPKVLFVPTASSDDEEYCVSFEKVFKGELGAQVDFLRLFKEKESYETQKKKILDADAIYVGGGNTLKMMRRWRYLGLDKIFIQACLKGTVCSGTSAGMLAWFESGHSDSMFYYHPEQWNYIRVTTLGMIPAIGCPHYHGEKRDENFRAMIQKTGGIGIACDDGAAIHVKGDSYCILTSLPDAHAYRVYRKAGKVYQEEIAELKEFTSLKSLWKI